jgi:hypothetical protein
MIEIIERATIETKGFNQNFGNNEDLQKIYKENGTILPEKNDAEINRGKDDLSKYPVVWIDGVQIESTNIITLQLFNNSFLPSLRLEFTDPSQKLIDENFPVDNSIISIFKNSNIKELMGMKMDFKITDLTIVNDVGKLKKKSFTYSVDAVMDIDDFYLGNFESYKGTSYDIIKKLMLEMKLGFATNTTNSKDEMIWINNANYRIEFIRDIIDRSYIDDDTFLFGYIDFYYNFNYIDVEKQIKEDISSQMNLMEEETISKDSQNSEVPLILTNNPDQENTNMYIQKYTIMNSSTNINLLYGYRHRVTYYNKIDDNIERYYIDAISDDDNNSAIILKGNPRDNNLLYNDMNNNSFLGKMDTDNVHKNFLHSEIQNKNNLKFLQKLKMTVRLSKVNYGLYRFQKVLVELYDMGRLNKTEKSAYTGTEIEEGGVSQHDDKILNKLSGEWLITSINITFSRENGIAQELTLAKRELTKEYTFPRRVKGNNPNKKKNDEANQKSSADNSNISYDTNPLGNKYNIPFSKDDLLGNI